MPTLKENAFTFVSQALPEDTFTVVRFSGEEGLSTLYRFEILLVSEKEDVDLTAVLQNPATLTIKGRFSGAEDLPYHGILSSFEQMHQAGEYVFYRAELRPKAWWLTLTHHNQIFLNKKLHEYLSEVLEDGGLLHGLDFEFQLQEKETPREYVCQYGESHFAFVSRWMEWDGIYYWFEQGEQGEKLIASDTLIAHVPLSGHETMTYSPPSGLDAGEADHVIKRFTLKQSPLPKNVLLKDYNYMKPSLDLEGKAPVQDGGRGEIYLYGENFLDKSEGDHLAKIRAEEYRCREKVFHGLSSIPALRPGYAFQMQRHFREEFNQGYLTTHVRHEGSQEHYLLSGLGLTDLDAKDDLFYRNTFECIPASTQFRPPRATPKPRMAGTLSAKVDAAGSGKYAELDKHGRYKVILPFDLSGRKEGKASAYLRMMQPYAGEGMGFHAPLHKGTEVLLSFIEADPDRPVIAGAVPNPETPSPVNDANQTQVRLLSGGGNVMHMEDEEGKQRMLMHTPSANTFIRLGAPNDPATGAPNDTDDDTFYDTKEHEDEQDDRLDELETEWGVRLFTDKLLKVQAGGENTIILGNSFELIAGGEENVVVGVSAEANLISKFGFTAAIQGEWAPEKLNMHLSHSKLETEVHQLSGSVNTLRADHNTLDGTVTQLRADHNTLDGTVTQLRADHNTLDGTVNQLRADHNTLDGTVNQLRADHNTLDGTVNQLRGDHNALAGTVNNLSGDHNALAGAVNNLNDSVNNLTVEQTFISVEQTTISTTIILM
ncbi:type VI secretion system Vgr family protein [Desulfonatronum sp. SC1]|uniref:type VI secretion system Vgr family protein n=1 Tax=Desulfonatronum sp. SC1 TaxID=2109626 RepID=UPI000D3155F8|nr:type VI secretion system tip protein TssI/VgrG [Desulfonatronum sp. SC1]PTN36719.1 type VI secretion system tip protein VgrG [Desulfonatronum sp. SC1]